jgi:sulfotransferase
MIQKVFFNASLPRAGSTLLQNVLMQNPEIYSSPTSGVIELLLAARTIYSNGDAFRAQDQKQMELGMQGYLRSGLYGFYGNITDRPYAIDKSRAWIGNWRFLNFVEPNPKIICMVRDLRAVFASMEKNFRKNPHKDPGLVDASKLQNMSTDSRMMHFSTTPPIGPTLEWLYDAITQGLDKNILFIRFEDFTKNPENEMRRVYNYLELPYYQHDFDNVEQLTNENDTIHGIFGDHKIKNKIEPQVDDYNDILGFHNSDKLKQHYSWFFTKFNY